MSFIRSIGPFALLATFASGATAQQAPAPAPPAPAPAKPATPAADTQVVTAEAVHAVVLPMKGSYMQHPQAFERLGSYLAGRAVAPAGPIFARYFSDPSVGEENLVWEVGFPVASGVTAEAPFEVRDLPAGLTAVRVHRGPMEELGSAWGSFMEWVTTNGYQPAGPATQVFKGDLAAAPEVEMRMPVTK
jgi:effector-binding domain-containing protein